MLRIVLILVALFFGTWTQAGDSYSARTLSFDAEEPKQGDVKLLWTGEIVNDSVRDATLCAVVVLLDEKGRVLKEMESATVNVARFGKVQREEVFEVEPGIWSRADTIDQTAKWSTRDPINGSRIRHIELYTTSWCPYCTKARDYLIAKGVDFIEFDVEAEAEARQRKNQLNPQGSIPTAVIDGHVIVGFSKSEYEKALNSPPQ